MAELSGVQALQSEIEKSKDKLRSYNENIKKLTGRDPSRPGVHRFLVGEGAEREEDAYTNRASRGRGRLFGLARRGIMEDNEPPAKRRIVGGAFSRLGPVPTRRREREDSPYEEELPNKLSVHSSVVATSREAKNRREIILEQTKDKEGMQRNRRMFGLLLGTLSKFRTESKTLETKEVQRKKIEEKLEENAEKEKRKFKMETKLLMEEMHLEQSKITRLQQKMDIVQEHSDREEEMMKLKNFIATKSKPRIFWRPRQMSAMLEGKQKDSWKVVDGMLQKGRDRLEKEIKELMEREYKREERIKMRLREDGLLEDGGEGGVNGGIEGDGIMGQQVVEVKEEVEYPNSLSDRFTLQAEEKACDEEEEEEMERDRDTLKKSKRTVIVEHEKGESSDSDDEEFSAPIITDDTDRAQSQEKSTVQEKHRTGSPEEEDTSEEEDDRVIVEVKKSRQTTEKSRDGKEERKRRKSSAEEYDGKNGEREDTKERSGDKDSHRKERREEKSKRREESEEDKSKKSREENKKVLKRDSGDRASRERDRLSRDMSSKDRDISNTDRNRSSRERDRSGKEKRADRKKGSKKSYGEGRKHKGRHDKSRRRRSSASSEIEVKQEKEEIRGKSKDQHREERSQLEIRGSERSNLKCQVNLTNEDDAESESEQNNST